MRRTRHFHMLLSADEKERLKKLASLDGMTMGAYLRSKIRDRWKQMQLPLGEKNGS